MAGMEPTQRSHRVAILLATSNGAAFLDEQLRSLEEQTHPAIDIWVSDDGSRDGTWPMLETWQGRWTKGTFRITAGPCKGFAENFRSLIRNGDIGADYFAFCDQDDIWEPDKLEKAIGWMDGQNDAARPLLFCSRTLTVTQDGTPVGHSPLFRRLPSFRNALVQSIAGGNTMLLNRAARDLVAIASSRTGFVSHDWWAYMIVTGAGGTVYYSATPFVRYRQHGANVVGANNSWRARVVRFRSLFQGRFARWNEQNIDGLERNRDLLTPDALMVLDAFTQARRRNILASALLLRRSGVYRQTFASTALLRVSVLVGLL